MDNVISVLILTHRLGNNFGGILQAYALQLLLKGMSSRVCISDFHIPSKKKQIHTTVKQCVKNMMHVLNPSISNVPVNNGRLFTANTRQFVDSYMNLIDRSELTGNRASSFDVLVVGSDQVWRQKYVPVDKYLFDFAEKLDITRISYAASFGRDDLSEYNPALLKKSARLAKKFDAISVREDSGVGLVKRHWGVGAEQHVDPTLLLEADHYEKLVQDDSDNVTISKGNLFAYVLDHGEGKGEIINKTSSTLGLKSFEIMPPKAISRKEFFANPAKYQLPPVTQWLKSFMDAKFVVTDSFHGCAFSIIFNKPFIAVGNKERGLARFTSLLKVFGLENRLVSDVSEVTDELLKSKIDWARVNEIKKKEQKRSMEYLNKYLKQS